MAFKPNHEMSTSEKKAFIQYRRWIGTYGAPPSLMQLAKTLSVTKTAAAYLVRKLGEKGYLRPEPKTGRYAISAKGKAV
jgi:hypothetical protein